MTAPADYRRRARLSWRIRAYVAVLALRHLGFAASLLNDRDVFRASSSFRYVFDLLPPTGWAWLFAVLGVASLGGLISPREKGIRVLVVISVGISTAWAAGLVLAAVVAPPAPSGFAVVAFASFALKDLIVAGMIYVNPLEGYERASRRGRLP